MDLNGFFADGHSLELSQGEHFINVERDIDNEAWVLAQSDDGGVLLRSTRPEHVVIAALCWINTFRSSHAPASLDWLDQNGVGCDLDPIKFLAEGHRLQFWSPGDLDNGCDALTATIGFARGSYYVSTMQSGQRSFDSYYVSTTQSGQRYFDSYDEALAVAKQKLFQEIR
jgi:hypothetical protein